MFQRADSRSADNMLTVTCKFKATLQVFLHVFAPMHIKQRIQENDLFMNLASQAAKLHQELHLFPGMRMQLSALPTARN